MKTNDLVAILASGANPVDAKAASRRYIIAVGCGALVAMFLMIVLFGVRPTLVRDAILPMFWVKVAFCTALAAGGLAAVARLARPGIPLGWVPAGLAAPALVMWMLAAATLIAANPWDRTELIFGQTSTVCPSIIALLSAPILVGLLWTVKSLAATRPRLTGAAAGIASGAIGALVYTLHCPELAAPFLAIWYSLGMLIPTVVGSLIGPSLLYW